MSVFELRDTDVAGRIGELSLPRSGQTIETPALLPVINPHVRTIEPSRLPEFGAEMLITNAYILYGSEEFRTPALEDGLHEMLEFEGGIMTDSGAFQLAEYGEIDVDTPEILAFQRDIGSDIATPVDIPTPPGEDRSRAESDLETTQERLETAAAFDAGDMLVTAPVQGSTFPDLREEAGKHAYATGLDIFPIGAVVPLLNDYRFDDVVDVVVAAKHGLGSDAPVHLFGAGHPMMFALAVAMGCDLFDSAAYALYARDGRYLTVRGTTHLDELSYFPCSCPICAEYEPTDLITADEAEQERLLAAHNLHVSFAEIDRIKQAIRDGTLLELLEERARAHPAMLDAYRALLVHDGWLETHHPIRGDTVFHLSEESASRPEIGRYHDRLARLNPPDRILLSDDPTVEPDDVAGEFDTVWRLFPSFGPVPPALLQTHPFTAEFPTRLDRSAQTTAIDGISRLAAAHPDIELALLDPGWPEEVLDRRPDTVPLLTRK